MTRVVDVSNSASFEDVAVMKFLEASPAICSHRKRPLG